MPIRHRTVTREHKARPVPLGGRRAAQVERQLIARRRNGLRAQQILSTREAIARVHGARVRTEEGQ